MSTIDLGTNPSELDIVLYPDPVLAKKASSVEAFNGELKDMAESMLHTMYQAPGIGLAAPQVGNPIRMFVLDVDFEREVRRNLNEDEKEEYEVKNLNPQVFINPTITVTSKEKFKYKEGCLSLPGIYDDVIRPKDILVNYYDIKGNKKELQASGLLSICIQHEADHLDGVMFIDRLSQLKKTFYKKKFLKQRGK